ncbi:MAG: hypothetical protein CEE40_06050 [Chloroflexi bacterium B3_Chlor]|nr:MAG: hypothetical protein CEE40_06050 [Chloroflexi bacterium B3_Chlor]
MRARMLDFLRKMGKSEHELVEESLSAYIDGELSFGEKAQVEKHLEECQACSENLATLRQTVVLLGELPTVPAPISFALRPAPVRPKARVPAPAWGYGLLKGATALAALLLVLLIGGDLTVQFLGGFPLATRAPLAPAAEVALAPSTVPSVVPAPAEVQPIVGETKATQEETETAPPPAAEEPPAPAPAPTEPPEAYRAPSVQDVASPAARAEGAGPADTPTAMGTPVETPTWENECIGSESIEPTVTCVPEPLPSPAAPEGAEPTAQTTPLELPKEEDAATTAVPTPTSEVVAMAELPAEETHERDVGYYEAQTSPLLPLRLAELIVFILLILLVLVTLVTRWLVRRHG